ncbi:hypothetical protein pb186bvf_004311 [Paramecium bursaria]
MQEVGVKNFIQNMLPLFPEIPELDHVIRRQKYCEETQQQKTMRNFDSKYSQREFMIKQTSTYIKQRPVLMNNYQSSLYMDYQLSNMQQSHENPYHVEYGNEKKRPNRNSGIIIKQMIIILFFIQAYTLENLKNVTSKLIKCSSCNLEALKTCALKSYILDDDRESLFQLGKFHLFGFPKNKGDEYLEFCQNYADMTPAYNTTYFDQDIDLAFKYFLKSDLLEAKVYMDFIKKLKGKKSVYNLNLIHGELAGLRIFTKQYRCLKIQQQQKCDDCQLTKYDIYAQLSNETLAEDCMDCNNILLHAFVGLQPIMDDYQYRGPQIDFDEEELIIIQQQAENNDEDALFELATFQYAGNENLGIEPNEQLAQQLFAQLENNPAAQFNLGLIYLKNKEYKKALDIFDKAANNHNFLAYEGLAHMYANGYYVEKDIQRAKVFYGVAASAGSKIAEINIALLQFYEGLHNQAINRLKKVDTIESKWAIISLFIQDDKVNITCSQVLEYALEIMENIGYQQYQYKDDEISQEWAAYIGFRQPLSYLEQFMINIPGAATELANQIDNIELQLELYKIDQNQYPQALYLLSYYYDLLNEKEMAFQYINKLIRLTREKQFDILNLIPAYIWKLKLSLL